MNKNTSASTENRYTILGTEIKRLSAELKAKKNETIAAIRKLESEYRNYRKNVYAPARNEAFNRFKATKVKLSKKVATSVDETTVNEVKA